MKLPVLLLVLSALVAAEDAPEVDVKAGKLRGKYMHTRKGRKFSGFLGIPYAKPPVGNLRFKAPEDAEGWEGTRDATEDSEMCYQRNPYTRSEIIEGDEDCLYLNVYTPQLPSYGSDPLPVMVFFHGGGWICGAGTSRFYGPEVLLEREVVLVMPNFRLGPLGFLSTGDSASPGNAGLKDQVAALKWIRDNVARFGGDPNKVTAFGESAGGASVDLHSISPLSRGLFHAGISQSGTALCPWALASEGEGRRNAEKLAKSLGCPTEDSHSLVECLRRVKAHDIIDKDSIFWEWDYDPMIPFKPVVEHEHDGAFLPEHPVKAIKEGRMASLPWITGITASEGALRVAGLLSDEGLLGALDAAFDTLAPVSLLYDRGAPGVTDSLRSFYLRNDSLLQVDKQNIVNMYTDAWFLSALDESVRLRLEHVPKAPVYLYYFAHRGVASFSQVFGDPHRDYGVCHADDLQYLFPVSDGLFPDQPPDERDKTMADIITAFWTNFATTGEPSSELLDVTWKPASTADLEHLHIGGDHSGDVYMEARLLPERVNFWRQLPAGVALPPERPAPKDEL